MMELEAPRRTRGGARNDAPPNGRGEVLGRRSQHVDGFGEELESLTSLDLTMCKLLQALPETLGVSLASGLPPGPTPSVGAATRVQSQEEGC